MNSLNCSHAYIIKNINKFLKYSLIKKNTNILDAGCGGGFITNYLYNVGFKNIWGFDISPDGIELAKKSYSNIKYKFFIHDGYNPILPSTIPLKFNLVLSIEVIEHLFNPQLYLNNINNWLADDGYLLLSTPYHGYFKNIATAILNRFDSHVHSSKHFGHIKFYSKKTIYKQLNDGGFKPIRFIGCGRPILYWKSMLILTKKYVNKHKNTMY